MKRHMATKKTVLLGAGGHARVVWDTLKLISAREDIEVVAVLDDNPELWGKAFMGLTIRGPIESVAQTDVDAAIVAIGDNRARARIFDLVRSSGIQFISAVHPSAVLAEGVRIGKGTVAFANVVVNIGANIGEDVILNTACSVDHDCIIGSHVHLAPRVGLAGGVRVGEGTLMGIGSVAVPYVKIGEWAVIGAGSVAIEDIPDRAIASGIPARVMRVKDQNAV